MNCYNCNELTITIKFQIICNKKGKMICIYHPVLFYIFYHHNYMYFRS